ncbi:uncharacterized protein METZ01_LOCUS366007 [marine metagenome]|uniref:Uncharacterized protein n=1 Tax=marine metagenome TaxID=408172 RepID=A0A382STP5_9ZZZZ
MYEDARKLADIVYINNLLLTLFLFTLIMFLLLLIT